MSKQKATPVNTVKRRSLILEELKTKKQVYTSELQIRFKVSEVTIRKDFAYLEKKGLLIRSRGGAMMNVNVGNDLSVEERNVINLETKKLIAKAACTLIEEGDTIIIDSGTTLMQLAVLLKSYNHLTIITNALDIVLKLSEYKNLRIIVPGGIFRNKSFSLVGVNAVENLQMFRADKYFVSCDGLNQQGLYTSNIEEGQIAKTIISNAKQNILLADSSKFDRVGLINFAPLSKIHTIVTDKKAPAKYLDLFSKIKTEVLFAALS